MKLSDRLKRMAGRLTGVYSETVTPREPFMEMAGRFARMPGTVLLMSGGELDCAAHHILAVKPWLAFHGRGRDFTIDVDGRTIDLFGNPLEILKEIVETFHLEAGVAPAPAPISAGLFGYLGYDLKDCLEKLPRTSVDDHGLPHICMYAPSVILVHYKKEGVTRLFIPERGGSPKDRVNRDLAFFHQVMEEKAPGPRPFHGDSGGFGSNFTRPAYLNAVRDIKEYIAAGHVYQVNLSQRFDMGFSGDPFTLFRTLYADNPAPFFAYINAVGDHQVVSTSPERFILRRGSRVETRPIKGTRPRGNTREEDEALRRELTESRKDDAELSMIVDLMRNDIGKMCVEGSVRVAEHKRLEAYENVYHLVSVVEGKLDRDKDSVDLIKATFPGGSITGCPKIRSMEIIDELEPNRRHVYTGSIGYISFHDSMDLSIAIRTAVVHDNRIVFSVGGGIVHDSDPGDEFEETLHKGKTLMAALRARDADSVEPAPRKDVVWKNGVFQPVDRAMAPVTDEGLLYGYGFFETIRVDKGSIRFLEEHLARFDHAWKSLFPDPPPDLTWADIIDRVITDNRLRDETAVVKILATMGSRRTPPFNHTLLVSARPYTHRLAGKKDNGLALAVHPHPRQTPLAEHKTLNYLYYLLAGKWAGERGADEALILNPDGSASETNTANILAISGRRVTRPASPHVLSGVMDKVVCDLLSDQRYEIHTSRLTPGDLLAADQVLLTNSLMGVVPVSSIDGKPTGPPTRLWKEVNETFFSDSTRKFQQIRAGAEKISR